MPPFGKVQEFEDDKPYIELCWEAEQDARFLLGISNDRASFSMRAEPVTPAGQRILPPTGSPLRKSYTQNREIKTESIYSQFKNNRATSALDNRASFLPYRSTKKEVSSKPSRTEKRLSTAILSKTPTGRNKTPASRSKSDSETYRYSQDYNTGTLTRDDDIDHLEDLRLSLLSWTTTTHESFVGSAGVQDKTTSNPPRSFQRSVNGVSVKRDWREVPKRTPERRLERKSPSVAYSGRSSRLDDIDATDEEVARITAGASHATSISFNGSQRSRSAQDLRDSLFADSPTDPYYEAQSLAHKRRMEYDGKTFFSGAMRMPMRRYNFMA